MKGKWTMKLIAVILSFLMTVTSLPAAAFADERPLSEEIVQDDVPQEEIVTEDPAQKEVPAAEETLPDSEEDPGEDASQEEPGQDPAQEQQIMQEEETDYPAFTPETVKIGDVEISVAAPEGVFPEGAILSVDAVSDEEREKADEAIEST